MHYIFSIVTRLITILVIVILLIIFVPNRGEKDDSEEILKNMIDKVDKKRNFGDFVLDLERKQIRKMKNKDNIQEKSNKLIKFHGFESISVGPDDDLKKVFDLMIQFDVDQICVVSKKNPRKLIGVINKEDIMRFFHGKLSKQFPNYNVN